jgi:hypothetical protein
MSRVNIFAPTEKRTLNCTVEQLSYLDISTDFYLNDLMTRKQIALEKNDTLVNIGEIDRRIGILTRTKRGLLELLDE